MNNNSDKKSIRSSQDSINHINYKRGQAAFEFMMTYGWALLVILAIIGSLVYFMPHPDSLTAKKCVFGVELPCAGTQLSSNNLTVVLKNGLGKSVYNISANVTVPVSVSCSVSNTTLVADGRITITCINNGVMNLTKDTRIKMVLTYKKNQGGYDQIMIGEIYAKYD
ncbi:MAG: hypothetical protein ACP5NW_03140 [Candidatus Woesearchaeota archaeon]